MCQPYIHDDYLPDLFGEATQYVKDTFLTATGDHRYRLKKHVDTQRKIDAFISANDKEKAAIRTGLKILTCQVLFVHDANDASKLHPRIAMQQSFVFQALPMVMKEAFSKLYNNFFYVRNNDFWRKNAMDKLPALLKSTQMMVCGEDLGMVPDCVHPVMDELQILSLEIQRMPKEFGVEFGDLNKVPYLSVCTSSSHDMSTMRQWWEENPDRTQRFFNNVLREYGPAPIFCEPWICQRIIEMHLATKAMWVILPLQDWIAMDGKLRNDDTFSERINNPANPDNYWHYRMHLNLEDLIGASSLNQRIKALIKYYGR
jgi:4-alpha-glucanotransferase